MRLTIAVASFCLFATAAEAQVCRGYSSFDVSHARVSAGYVDGSGTNVYSLGAAVGRSHGGFASLDVGTAQPRNTPPGYESSNYTVSGMVGTAIRPASLGGIELCPLVGYSYGHFSYTNTPGSNVGHSNTMLFGGAAGASHDLSTSVKFIPSLELGYQSVRQSGESSLSGPSRDYSIVSNRGYALIAAGFGFSAFSIAPTLSRPLGIRYPATVWGLRGAIHF